MTAWDVLITAFEAACIAAVVLGVLYLACLLEGLAVRL